MRGLAGKHVIVTGSGSGIGREIACRFAAEGSEVARVDMNGDGAAETLRLIEEKGGKGAVYTVDITDRAAVDRAVAAAEKVRPIDVLVNNAGWDRMVSFQIGRASSRGRLVYSKGAAAPHSRQR